MAIPVSSRPVPKWGSKPQVDASASISSTAAWELYCASEITPTKVDFLWHPYIPRGRITSIEGNPGVGKSWLTSAIAAHISLGKALPGQDGYRSPGKVLMLSAEDGLADTIVPRLMALDANLENVYFPKQRVTLDASGVKGLDQTMRALDATIVFIDPIQFYVGSKVDMNKANEVRGFMDGLHIAAEKSNCAVVIVRHLRKASSDQAIYRGLGSIDFAAAVRSIIHVEAGDGPVRYMAHVKCNNAAEGPDLTYFVADYKFEWGEQSPHGSHHAKRTVSTSPRRVDEAQTFLRFMLADGPVPAVDAAAMAANEGFSESTLKRAKKGLVRSVKTGDGWFWELEPSANAGPARG